MQVRTQKRLLAAVLAMLAGIANYYLLRYLGIFGSPLLFAGGLFLEFIAALISIVYLFKALRIPRKVAASLVRSAWKGVLANRYVGRVRVHQFRLYGWLAARFKKGDPKGRVLTLGTLLGILLLFYFFNVMSNVITGGTLVGTDSRIINLMSHIRTPDTTAFFHTLTFMGNWQTIYLLCLALVIYFWRRTQKLAAGVVVLAILIDELTLNSLKHIVERARPAQALALVKTDTLSFPSGHTMAVTIIYGLITYFIVRSLKHTWAKLTVASLYLLLVFLVGLSRVYLGVHYPSDVIAGPLFGGFVLTFLITGLEIIKRSSKKVLLGWKHFHLIWLPVLALVWAIIFPVRG